MSISDLVPWRWGKRSVPVRRETETVSSGSMLAPWFDEMWNRFSLAPFWFDDWFRFGESWSAISPRVDVVQDDKEVRVSVELPGMDEKDFDISLSNDVLTIRGEKKAEKEEKGKNYYRMERAYGAFERRIPLPAEVDADKAEATYQRGVLTVVLPKIASTEKGTKITVKSK